MNAILHPCALAHEERAAPEQLSVTARFDIGHPNRRQEIRPE
jgi:hypothetical protein